MSEYKKKRFGDSLVMTTWDVAQEIFGNSEPDNYRKVRQAFMENPQLFSERKDFFDVPRQVIVSFGVYINPCYSRTRMFQLYTKEGVDILLACLGMSELKHSLDHLFEDDGEGIKVESTSLFQKEPVVEDKKKLAVLVKEETAENNSVFSDSMLSLVTYITMSKALFSDKRFSDLEVGAVIFNSKTGALEIVTNIMGMPSPNSTPNYALELTIIKYDKEEKKWNVKSNHCIMRTTSMGIMGLNVLSAKGVDFILALKEEARTNELNNSLTGIQSLLQKRNELQEQIDNKLSGLYALTLP